MPEFRFKELEPQGVQDNADGTEAHGRRTEHGVQLPAQGGEKHTRRQGDAQSVVDEGPEEVFPDVADD